MSQLISDILNNQLVIQIFSNLLVVLITTGVGYLIAILRKRLGVEGMKKIQTELSLKQDLVDLAVKMVQQTFSDLHGEDKYNKAVEWIVEMAKTKNIQISDAEIKGLIESAVRTFKDKFGEDWGKAVSETPASTPEVPAAK